METWSTLFCTIMLFINSHFSASIIPLTYCKQMGVGGVNFAVKPLNFPVKVRQNPISPPYSLTHSYDISLSPFHSKPTPPTLLYMVCLLLPTVEKLNNCQLTLRLQYSSHLRSLDQLPEYQWYLLIPCSVNHLLLIFMPISNVVNHSLVLLNPQRPQQVPFNHCLQLLVHAQWSSMVTWAERKEFAAKKKKNLSVSLLFRIRTHQLYQVPTNLLWQFLNGGCHTRRVRCIDGV